MNLREEKERDPGEVAELVAALEEESREMASGGSGNEPGSERDSSVEARVRCRWGGWA